MASKIFDNIMQQARNQHKDLGEPLKKKKSDPQVDTKTTNEIDPLRPTKTDLDPLKPTETDLNRSKPMKDLSKTHLDPSNQTHLDRLKSIETDLDPLRPTKTYLDPLKNTIFHASEKQYKIYQWLLNNREKGFYNNGIISRDIGLSKDTIKTAITRLKQVDIVWVGKYDYGSRSVPYKINFDIAVKAVLEEEIDPLRPIKTDLDLLRPASRPTKTDLNRFRPTTSYKKEERSFLNLSVPEFWEQQGLTLQKIKSWVDEFGYSEEEMQNQLDFGEHEPLVVNADKGAIKYLYGALKKGGLSRPVGFEFPEERRARIAEENLKNKQEALNKLQKAKDQAHSIDEDIKFENWWQSLSESHKNEVDSKSKFKGDMSLGVHRKQYWRKNIEKMQDQQRKYPDS